MKKLFNFIFAILVVAYPFAVYFGLEYFSPKYLALFIAFMFLSRFMLIRAYKKAPMRTSLFWVTLSGIFISILGVISNQDLVIKLYPVMISLVMFSLFLYSFLYPPTIIESLARIKEPDLSEAAIRYIRKLTLVWCGFFVINGAIALWTVLFATVKIWAIYNGFLSYILIGVLFVAEFIYRYWAKRQNHLS